LTSSTYAKKIAPLRYGLFDVTILHPLLLPIQSQHAAGQATAQVPRLDRFACVDVRAVETFARDGWQLGDKGSD